MRSLILGMVIVAVIAASTLPNEASAGGKTRTVNDLRARRHANDTPWHGPYYHREYGAPVALVVPPTATSHTQWSWGVAQSRVMPTYHQFGRAYPGGMPGEYGGQLYPTPAWPSHTDQFGAYPVRGPW